MGSAAGRHYFLISTLKTSSAGFSHTCISERSDCMSHSGRPPSSAASTVNVNRTRECSGSNSGFNGLSQPCLYTASTTVVMQAS